MKNTQNHFFIEVQSFVWYAGCMIQVLQKSDKQTKVQSQKGVTLWKINREIFGHKKHF